MVPSVRRAWKNVNQQLLIPTVGITAVDGRITIDDSAKSSKGSARLDSDVVQHRTR